MITKSKTQQKILSVMQGKGPVSLDWLNQRVAGNQSLNNALMGLELDGAIVSRDMGLGLVYSIVGTDGVRAA